VSKIWKCNNCGKESAWGPGWLAYGTLDSDTADHVVCSDECGREFCKRENLPFNHHDLAVLRDSLGSKKERPKIPAKPPTLPGLEPPEKVPVELTIRGEGVYLRLWDKKPKTPQEADQKIVELWTALREMVDAAVAALNSGRNS
jgi:hypothetical protein